MTRDGSPFQTKRSGLASTQSLITLNSERPYSDPSAPESYGRSYYNLNHSVPTPAPPLVPLNNNYEASSLTMLSPGTHGTGFTNQCSNHATNVKSSQGASSKLRETIHSGQFMVSDFEPESEVLDEEYEAGMPVPCVTEDDSGAVQYGASEGSRGNGGGNSSVAKRSRGQTVSVITMNQKFSTSQPTNLHGSGTVALHRPLAIGRASGETHTGQTFIPSQPIIDGSLTKLFQCMSLAYRQKLTSPKWNPFKGVRLRWKDKIRLNNVIWRCWHMQFILRRRAMVCQFASPLDNDQHNKPEAVVMEGKYWKRKLSTVAAEYKKWRLFYRNRIMGWTHCNQVPDLHPVSLDGFDWSRPGTFGNGPMSNIVFDDELLMDFSDTLFSSLSSQPFAFPNPRELSRAGMVADFIQPGLVQLQPNLEDFMDTLEPFQDFVNTRFLPAVPEEIDTIDTSSEPTLNLDLPNFIQNRIQSSFLKQGAAQPVDNQAINYSSIHSEQSTNSPIFYSMNQNEANSRVANSSQNLPSASAAPQTSALLKEAQKPSGKSSTNSRDDIFAVPRGKPRGRSRSGNRQSNLTSQAQHSAGNSMAPLTPISHVPSQSPMQITRAQQSSMSNSHTLLSHLLTTPGHGHFVGTAGGVEKSNSGSISLDQGMCHEGSEQPNRIPIPGSLIDIQQHQQPWNPKNANDTLSGNASLNFNAKAAAQGLGSDVQGASGGNNSPPRMSNTPSPPMGCSGLNSGPPSPPKLFRTKGDTNERVTDEHRRVCHINAEQKRRCNIKNGFDMLHSLIPQLSHNPNAKVSKAAMLQKGAEYIRQLKVERAKLKQEIESHRQEVETLNSAINNCQSMLPATGAPVSRQRTNKMKEMFDRWVRMRTLENWKFWLFSFLVRPLLDSYNNAVSTASLDELCRTVLAWIDQHCSLVDLRPAVLNSLRFLCTTTDILTNPANLPEEANRAVNRLETNLERERTGSSDAR